MQTLSLCLAVCRISNTFFVMLSISLLLKSFSTLIAVDNRIQAQTLLVSDKSKF